MPPSGPPTKSTHRGRPAWPTHETQTSRTETETPAPDEATTTDVNRAPKLMPPRPPCRSRTTCACGSRRADPETPRRRLIAVTKASGPGTTACGSTQTTTDADRQQGPHGVNTGALLPTGRSPRKTTRQMLPPTDHGRHPLQSRNSTGDGKTDHGWPVIAQALSIIWGTRLGERFTGSALVGPAATPVRRHDAGTGARHL